MARLALDLENVSKTYPNGVQALDGLCMTVEEGTVFGLLGPNGAGKSTLVKVLMTLVRPDTCDGHLLGSRIGHPKALKRTGYLPENAAWPAHLTAREILVLAGSLRGISRRTRLQQCDELLALTGLTPWENDRPAVFSKGMRQRLGFAWALMGNPDLIFLDEPLDGVDPVGRKEFRDIILSLRAQGKTIFINSHVLGELELMCDSVGILSRGRLARQGTLESMTRESFRYDIEIAGNALTDTLLTAVVHHLGGELALDPEAGVTRITIPTRRPHLIQPVIDEIRRRGHLLISASPARQSLEDLFLEAITASRGNLP
ncbi:MAG: ABC transporter ATP-binding protein [Verrucomicrobiota bacterium]|jgi:ABC-2 type transport system ATP-binding protein